MSEKIHFKVDGEWLTSFIRKLYYAEDMGYKDCKERLINSLCLQEVSEEEKEELVQAIIFGDKKLVGVNSFELVEDIDFDVYDYSRVSRPTNFIENKGVTGILTSAGVFAECRYGGHNDILNFVDDGHQNISGAITFSTGRPTGIGINDNSYVYMDTTCYNPTKYQIRWYENNKVYLNETQRHLFERYMRKRDKYYLE